MTCNGYNNDRMLVVALIVIAQMHELSDDDKKENEAENDADIWWQPMAMCGVDEQLKMQMGVLFV